jgi:hypothetical protein
LLEGIEQQNNPTRATLPPIYLNFFPRQTVQVFHESDGQFADWVSQALGIGAVYTLASVPVYVFCSLFCASL